MRSCTVTLAVLSLTAAVAWPESNMARLVKLSTQCDLQGNNKACHELLQIAEQDKDMSIRLRAVSLVWDQQGLVDLVLNDPDEGIRKAAFEHLREDSGAFAKVALECKDANMRNAAVQKLTDQVTLAKVALADNDATVRVAAVEKLSDQKALSMVVMQDTNEDAREAAVQLLTDQTVLATVAQNEADEHSNVRAAAIAKLEDASLVSAIGSASRNPLIRSAADRRLAALKAVTAQKALKAAIIRGDTASAEQLIAEGADPGDPDYLREAVKTGNRDLTQFLIAKGTHFHGDELLFLAASSRNIDLVRVLQPYGSRQGIAGDMYSKGMISETPADLCRRSGPNNIETFIVLSERGYQDVQTNQFGQATNIELLDSVYYIVQLSGGQVQLGECNLKLDQNPANLHFTVTDSVACPPADDADCLPY